MSDLRLEVREFESLAKWRWVLTGPGGKLLADHEVRLDAGCWQFDAFTDLPEYLRWRAPRDRGIEDEARIVAEVGEWVGAQVLGPVGAVMVEKHPATVRLVVPEEARALLFRPLELGHVDGSPLAVQGVTLVMQGAGDKDAGDIVPVGDRLRVLGLFSLPVGGQALNLRRERYALVRRLSGIAAVGRAVDVQVLQYGVTRARLQDVLDEGEGWDVIHISGHGAPGELLLETEDGSPDPVSAADLAEMLDSARERVKLVSVSACWSAALTATEARRLIGLPAPEGSDDNWATGPGRGGVDTADSAGIAGALATKLAGSLGCAVLAMRYPVVDDFAIALTTKLYELLADKGQPLPTALGKALRHVVAVPPTAACPALSVTTPALFGARAAGLLLAAPPRMKSASYDTDMLKMARFPPQSERFVGRTAVMARTSAALANASGVPGVLLHGMPGGGKTACALELAYTHEHAFDRLVWFNAPDEGRDITGTLTEFARTLEVKLTDFQMVHVLDDEARLAAFLPQLTEMCEQRRVLIVVDNVESLLSEGRQWKGWWGQVIAAMCGHQGLGRVLLTSRRIPADLDGRVRLEAVDALSLDEALLLARELPNLRNLMDGKVSHVERDVAQSLTRRILNISQGHPKLLELANGQAADTDRLGELVTIGDRAWQQTGGLSTGFFTTGQPQAVGEDYLHVLSAWTETVADTLMSGHKDLFWCLCCLQESDRNRAIVQNNWANLWDHLARGRQPPSLDEGLTALADRGLIALQPGNDDAAESYGIHPGVAAAGRVKAGDRFQEMVDVRLAGWWQGSAAAALDFEGKFKTGGLMVRSGISAVPYLLRLGQWLTAANLLQEVLIRDKSRATAETVLPALEAIAAAAQGTADESATTRLLANTQQTIHPGAAEPQMAALLVEALDRQDYRKAAEAASDLTTYWLAQGRLADAQMVADKAADIIGLAELGHWTQLGNAVQRLQVLAATGHTEGVFAGVQRLRAVMDTLPATSQQAEIVKPWNVRELLLELGAQTASQLERWQDALDLNAAVMTSMQARAAAVTDIARTRYNSYEPLIKLERVDDAFEMLKWCRLVFERDNDIRGLGVVLTALASVEDQRGHGDVAIDLECDALRYLYLDEDAGGIKVGHHNLGFYLKHHAHQPDKALAHHLAAALICTVTDMKGKDSSISAAADDLSLLGDDAELPGDVVDLSQRVAERPGIELDRLLMTFAPNPEVMQQALQELIAQIRVAAEVRPTFLTANLAAWDPVIAALLADQANTQAAAVLDGEFGSLHRSADWAALVGVLRRLRAGESGPDLLVGLDEIDVAIASRALDALAGRVTVPTTLWPAMPHRWLLGEVVAAALGETDVESAQEGIQALAEDPNRAALADALGAILSGERDPGLAAGLRDATDIAVVATVLSHIDTIEREGRMDEERITALPDTQAVAALQLVLERQGLAADPATLRDSQTHLIEALHQPDAHELARPETSATAGALARTALMHLAGTDPETREIVERAISISADSREREPVTLAVGALVLLAFRTDVRLEHDPAKGWTFKLHVKPLSDSAVGKMLSQLLGTYLK